MIFWRILDSTLYPIQEVKKLGFEIEGKLIQNRLLKNGKYCDELKWGLLKNEWKKINNGYRHGRNKSNW